MTETNLAMDDRIMIAMREARRHHLDIWLDALKRHKNHPQFQVQQWPYTLEYGFTCSCSGVEEEHRIRVHSLKEMLPEARASLFRMFANKQYAGNKLRKRQSRKAMGRARALLYRYLTRTQKLSMRADKSFEITGADHRQYLITEGSCNNVFTTWRGQELSLCVIPQSGLGAIPYYDLMLAQKVLLESDPAVMLNVAYVQNRTTRDIYESGKFLVDGSEPVVKSRGLVMQPVIRALPDEVLENPVEFMAEQMQGDLVMAEVVDEVEQQARRIETRTAE